MSKGIMRGLLPLGDDGESRERVDNLSPVTVRDRDTEAEGGLIAPYPLGASGPTSSFITAATASGTAAPTSGLSPSANASRASI